MAETTATAWHFEKYAGGRGLASAHQGGAGLNDETLTANKTLTASSAVFQRLDPGGSARTITLPTTAKGMAFRVLNAADAAETLTVKNAGGSTIATIAQDEAAWVVSDGSSWKNMGIESISLT